MNTKIEYLKACVQLRAPLESKSWYIMALSIPAATKDPSPLNKKPLELVKQDDGIYYVSASESGNTLVKIVDCKADEALFTVQNKVTIDNTWLSTVKSPTEVSIGNLFVNTVAIAPALGNKIGYVAGAIRIKDLEATISAKMKDDGEGLDPVKDISVSEYLDCMDRLWFFSKLANLVTIASSLRTVVAAPGTKELREKLLKENQGSLSDPVVVASIMEKLTKHDAEFMKGDPVAANMFDKKAKNARKKLHLLYGETNDFTTSLDSKPITTTMSDGVDTSDETLPKYMNDLRYASFSRGNSTQLSGYSYKILQRSLSGVEISDEDCRTNKGVVKIIKNPNELVGKYVRLSNKWTLIESEQQASPYKGKTTEVRSPMYCQSPGFTLCYKCMGEYYKGSKNAMNNLAANFSSVLMGMFLKRMHTSGFTLTTLEVADLVT